MRIEVLLIIDVKIIPPQPLVVFDRALSRRGWVSGSKGNYRIALETDAGDKQIVNYVGRDVKEAEYVAGLQDVQSVVLLNSRDSGSQNPFDQMQDAGSDVSLI